MCAAGYLRSYLLFGARGRSYDWRIDRWRNLRPVSGLYRESIYRHDGARDWIVERSKQLRATLAGDSATRADRRHLSIEHHVYGADGNRRRARCQLYSDRPGQRFTECRSGWRQYSLSESDADLHIQRRLKHWQLFADCRRPFRTDRT